MIDVQIQRLKLKHAWTLSRNSADYKDNVFVQITKDGITGVGEAAPNVRYDETAEKTVGEIYNAAHLFEENDLFHYWEIKAALDKTIVGQSCAKAALDMALMDWVGKALNVPLHKLWGLNPKNTVQTSYSIGIDTEEILRQKIADAAPYPILKIKLGRENDKEIIEMVRSMTDKVIRVDANEGWQDKAEALDKIHWLAARNVELIEQPMPAAMLAETAWLKERSPLPLIADEAVKNTADIPALAEAYHGINIKLMKSGGLLEALRMIHIAKAGGLKLMIGCMVETSIAISAAAQLAPFADWIDLDGNLLLADDPYNGITVKDGSLVYPDYAGIGVAF